jgi:hypothetical protein|tara:strand:- start:158 stop:487 length:330 start_codon:yes stop_codon:yes gene_type:complete
VVVKVELIIHQTLLTKVFPVDQAVVVLQTVPAAPPVLVMKVEILMENLKVILVVLEVHLDIMVLVVAVALALVEPTVLDQGSQVLVVLVGQVCKLLLLDQHQLQLVLVP